MNVNLTKTLNRLVCLMALLSVFTYGRAQNAGIRFENGLTWEQVKAKAKAENKYIFMDCYATWCGPCKYMAENIFTNARVSEYFNSHFINVAVQMDKTTKDEQATKNWYADAKMLAETYQVNAYPTYLFFSPDGRAVHQLVGEMDENTFVGKASKAFEGDKQYFSIKAEWRQHAADSLYLLNALKTTSDAADDQTAHEIGDAYLESLRNPVTKFNLQLVERHAQELITSSSDKWFKFYVSNVSAISQLIGDSSYVAALLAPVIFKDIKPLFLNDRPVYWKSITRQLEQKYPSLGSQLVKEEYAWFASQNAKEIAKSVFGDKKTVPDWLKIEKSLRAKYPDYNYHVNLLIVKQDYYDNHKLYQQSINALYDMLRLYGADVPERRINNRIEGYITPRCTDRKILREAAKWMKAITGKHPDEASYLDTYAKLLYKLGSYDDALATEKVALVKSVTLGDRKEITGNLEKMENRQPLWLDKTPVQSQKN